MIKFTMSDRQILDELGERLKQARLNANMTQQKVAEHCGISIKAIQGAEKGNTTLTTFVKIIRALGCLDQLDLFMPKPEIDPMMMFKMRGKKRQRASGQST